MKEIRVTQSNPIRKRVLELERNIDELLDMKITNAIDTEIRDTEIEVKVLRLLLNENGK